MSGKKGKSGGPRSNSGPRHLKKYTLRVGGKVEVNFDETAIVESIEKQDDGKICITIHGKRGYTYIYQRGV